MPYQPVEDRRRTVGAPAGGAGRPPPPLNGRPPPRPDRGRPQAGPKLFVVTGPSGAGKGTLIRELVARRGDLEVAVSATTRARRPGEVDGGDYHFVDEREFEARVARGDFLEHVVYVSGHRYGTLRSEVERILARGKSCILELETEGALAVRGKVPGSVTIFITASLDELERRLRERATESAGEIDERIALARRQLGQVGDFDYVVANNEVERAVAELEDVVNRETSGVGRLPAT